MKEEEGVNFIDDELVRQVEISNVKIDFHLSNRIQSTE